MVTGADSNECFARETLPDNEPSHGWGLIELEQYAQAQHEAIIRGETTLAPTYFRLGRCLELIRRQRGRSAWGKYLESLGIHRVRACKARAIARHFQTAEAVQDMTIEEAYELAKVRCAHRQRPERDQPDADDPDSREEPTDQDAVQATREWGVEDIAAFLTEVHAMADALIDAAAFADRDKRTALFRAYRAALERLQFLGRTLGVEDEARPGNGSLEARGWKSRSSKSRCSGSGEDAGGHRREQGG